MLPSLRSRTESSALLDTDGTRLGRAISPLVAAHPGQCGIFALRDARDGFAARFLLAQAAERTLDVQYYIWRYDMSGTLLFKALLDAADRGVRVRLLLDDNNTAGLDATLAALDGHPNIDVRLFNPFVIRRPHWLGYLTDFRRLNRRMHNKSFTADNQAAIVGGRNIGDEYFAAASAGVVFADLDVLSIGPVVHEVSSQFDRYWASKSSYPIDRLVSRAAPDEKPAFAEPAGKPDATAYMEAIRNSSFVHELIEHQLPLEWAMTRMISDDPEKVRGRAKRKSLLLEKIKAIFGEPRSRVDLVSPYFVPGARGVAEFRAWTKRGVKVQVLTNALESTDVTVVHAGYAKRRKALLRAGVTLYELRSAARIPHRKAGPMGSSSASLHAKTFAVDGSRVFVGSFNFDPRSARLNTEMGFVIDSAPLARQMETTFETAVPQGAYEVRLSDSGKMYWIERNDGEEIRHDKEPGSTLWRRAIVAVASRLPIEWLL
jgi:putative cardiolipin synthase